jgi:peroxiredoxin
VTLSSSDPGAVGEIALANPDGGAPVTLGSLSPPLLVVQLVRYFGCLPCQEWLVELDRLTDRLAEVGAAPVAVGGSADYQARWLREEKGLRMPLLLDPEQRLRHAIGIGRLGGRLLDPRGMSSYVRALRHGYRPQAITKDTVQAPGVVLLDERRVVVWKHEGQRIGDYPPLPAVLEAVTRVATRPPTTEL